MNKHTHAPNHRLPRSCVCARLLTKWLLTTSGSVVSTFRVTHHDASTNRSATRCAALRATAALCTVSGPASGRRCAGRHWVMSTKGIIISADLGDKNYITLSQSLRKQERTHKNSGLLFHLEEQASPEHCCMCVSCLLALLLQHYWVFSHVFFYLLTYDFNYSLFLNTFAKHFPAQKKKKPQFTQR